MTRQLVFDHNVAEARLDISQPKIRERVLLAHALMMRWGTLSPDDLARPERFRPTLFFAGPPYAGKTTHLRLLLRTLTNPQGPELRDAVQDFTAHHRFKRLTPDTTRAMRTEYGSLMSERQSNPYVFRDPDCLYRRLIEDQGRYQHRLKCQRMRSWRRSYGYWSHFGGEEGSGDLYGMPIKRLWLAAKAPESALYFEGSYEPAEWFREFFPNSILFFFFPTWYRDPKWLWPPRDQPWLSPEPLLEAYRLNQTVEERLFRLTYGMVVMGIIEDMAKNGEPTVDIHYYVPSGIDGMLTAIAVTFRLYRYLREDPDHQRLVDQYRSFLQRSASAIEKLSWSNELDTVCLTAIPPIVTRGLSGYRFSSPFSQPEGDVPHPRSHNHDPTAPTD